MPRIRSIHPEQWTDESFVSMSYPAQIACLGIRNLADDNGIIKLSPVEIKVRILPLADVDIDDVISEIIDAGHIMPYYVGDQRYAMIRNFQDYQSPQRPRFHYPVPGELEDGYRLHPHYEGSTSKKQESKSEPQKHEKKEQPKVETSNAYPDSFEEVWKIYPKRQNPSNKKKAYKAWTSRIRAGHSDQEILDGTKSYASYCDSEGLTGTRYVKDPATFFGPDEHFTLDWSSSISDNGGSGGKKYPGKPGEEHLWMYDKNSGKWTYLGDT